MQTKLKLVQTEKRRVSKMIAAADDLEYLLNFNQGISQHMAKTVEHLSDFVIITMANATLPRRDASLVQVKSGNKPHTHSGTFLHGYHLSRQFTEEGG